MSTPNKEFVLIKIEWNEGTYSRENVLNTCLVQRGLWEGMTATEVESGTRKPKPEDIVTDLELGVAFGSADFDNSPKREVVKYSLLQYACGGITGNTARSILIDLGLLLPSEELTLVGQEYLLAAFSEGHNY